jgi:hypothetical protein
VSHRLADDGDWDVAGLGGAAPAVATNVSGEFDWCANHPADFLQHNINQFQRIFVFTILIASGFNDRENVFGIGVVIAMCLPAIPML